MYSAQQTAELVSDLTTHPDHNAKYCPSPPDTPFVSPCGSRVDEARLQWKCDLVAGIQQLKTERRRLRRAETKKQIQLARAKFQQLFATKQKAANKTISGTNSL